MSNALKSLNDERRGVFIIAILFLSFGIGIVFDATVLHSPTIFEKTCLSNLKYINPEPGCEEYEKKLSRMTALQKDLEEQVSKYLQTGKAEKVSVFVRDLTSHRFAGVNDSDEFYMASLLKVPLAVAYFRLSEITPDLLSHQLTFTNVSDMYSIQNIEPANRLTIGTNYTVKDLLYRTLAYSDNTAAELLMQNYVSREYLEKVLLGLSLQIRKNGEKEDLVTAKSYAGVFRILYNSSFLHRNSSNEILKMMTTSDFTDGATLLLPKNVLVAHKFGERTALNLNNEFLFMQLHDCGIVYAKNGDEPYTFCIMTQGSNQADLKHIIQNLSKTIYTGIHD